MMKEIILFTFILTSYCFSAQTIYFKYDEAGNQIYRGINQRNRAVDPEEEKVDKNITNGEKGEEEKFWAGVRIYPVPVKDILTIDWNDETNDLISQVTLFQHNSLSYLLNKENIQALNKHIEINMRKYYFGVYVISFKLKNGKVFSKNIVKE